MIVLAHRGFHSIWPENTIRAFQAAVDLGAHALETDVRLTSDGQVVCFHDRTTDRLLGRSGTIETTRYESLTATPVRAFGRSRSRTRGRPRSRSQGRPWSGDYGDRTLGQARGVEPEIKHQTDPPAPEACVPLLRTVLRAFPNTALNIDLKTESQDLADATAALLRAENATDRVIVATFHTPLMDYFRSIAPEIPTAAHRDELIALVKAAFMKNRRALYTLDRLADSSLTVARSFQMPRHHGGMPIVRATTVELAHRMARQVHVWTVDKPRQIARFLQLGVDGIVTNNVPAAIAISAASPMASAAGPTTSAASPMASAADRAASGQTGAQQPPEGPGTHSPD